MVNSKLRRHKVMEKVIKKLMASNLPPKFKFDDTYDSIEVPVEYQEYLPTQQEIEAEFEQQIETETLLPTITTEIEDLDIISTNVYSDTTTGRVGIGTTSPVATLHIHSTDSIIVPEGTTAQRNQTPVLGMLRYNSETGYLETYTVGGWGSIASPPTITSFSPIGPITPAASNGTELTINGSFFDENTTVELQDTNGTIYPTTNFVFTNSRLITVTLGSLTDTVYTVVVTNGAGLSVDSTSTLVVNTPPVWSFPADEAIVEFFTNISSTTTLSASDPDGSTITYSLVSGTLPSGLTLSGSTISGQSGVSGETLNPITIRASDGIEFVDRSFTIKTIAPLYDFTQQIFTNAGASGRYGPTLTQCRNEYASAWVNDTSYFNVTSGIQLWTVPETATYRIFVAGAAGGNPYLYSYTYGRGATMQGNFDLTRGTVLKILIGQRGEDYAYTGGGGGGTFVAMTNDTPLIVAGGGGGAGNSGGNGWPGVTGINSGTSYHGYPGGTNGYGASVPVNGYGGGGAGFYSDGSGADTVATPSNYTHGTNARGFINGGVGGSERPEGISIRADSCNGAPGGFGGGGSGACNGGGGGGGYSGGANGGGGGGSYNSGASASQSNSQGVNTSVGYCIITKL